MRRFVDLVYPPHHAEILLNFFLEISHKIIKFTIINHTNQKTMSKFTYKA